MSENDSTIEEQLREQIAQLRTELKEERRLTAYLRADIEFLEEGISRRGVASA